MLITMKMAQAIARDLAAEGFGCLPVDVCLVAGGKSLEDSALESAILQAFDRYEVEVEA